MREIEFLQKWVELVQKINQWPHFSEWTNHQFQQLSDDISEKSRIKIDRNTIRRIVESVIEGKTYSPHITTKDALAFYAGQKNWLNFKKSLQTPENKSKRRNWIIITIVLIIFILSVLVFIKINNRSLQFEFSIDNPEGIIPHTVEVRCNFSNLRTDNITIDYGHINPDGNYNLQKVNRNTTLNKVCFHYPGDYNIRLFINDEVIDETKVWINSDDWFIYAIDAASYSGKYQVPELIKKAGFRMLQYIPFNGILEKQVDDGFFHIPKEKIMAIDGLALNYHLHLKNFKHYGVEMQNADFSIRFRDEEFGEGINCSECAIYLHCDNGPIGFKFAQPGCERYTHERLGNTFNAGSEFDLDYLIQNFKEFRTLSIKGRPGQILLYLDGIELKTLNYNQDLGEIRGMHLWFKGTPYIDFVRLADSSGKLIYNEEFDEFNTLSENSN